MPPRTKKASMTIRPDVLVGILSACIGVGGGTFAGSSTAENTTDQLKERVLVLEQAQSRTFAPQVDALAKSVETLNTSIAELSKQITSTTEFHEKQLAAQREQTVRLRDDVDGLLGRRDRDQAPSGSKDYPR